MANAETIDPKASRASHQGAQASAPKVASEQAPQQAAHAQQPSPDARPAPPPPAIPEARVQLGEYFNRTFKVTVPAGHPFDAILQPHYWAHVASKFQAGDILFVHIDDMSWFAMLYIRDVGARLGGPRLPNWAKVDVIQFKEFGAFTKPVDANGHEVRFMGPQLKWCVVRVVDQRIVFEGFGAQEDAVAKLTGYVRAMAS